MAGELLLTIVDCSPRSWDFIESDTPSPGSPKRCTFPELAAALQVFLAAFCCSSRHNRVAVLGFNGSEGGWLLLPPEAASPGGVIDHMRPVAIQRALESGLWRLRYGGGGGGGGAMAEEGGGERGGCGATAPPPPPPLRAAFSSLTSCLSLAMCLAHRRGAAGARLLAVQASPDVPSQYIAFNNAVVSAAHRGVVVDALVLSGDSSVFLQQAAHQTHGMYLKPAAELHAGLLQYLLQLLLPEVALRSVLLQPPQASVNLKAHCFCHKRFRSLAWMCTTCLSLWCSEHAQGLCATCKS
jgi:transcription initiation factor TFIIH subunit 3